MTITQDPSCDFGPYLRLNRKSRGKSLEEISTVTKIPVYRLRQLEEQDFDNLPAPVFVKGFVRAYAAAVGADIEDALQRFDASCSISLPQKQAVEDDQPSASGYWPRLLLAVVLLAALAIVTLLIAGIMETHVTETAPMDTQVTETAPMETQVTETAPMETHVTETAPMETKADKSTAIEPIPGAGSVAMPEGGAESTDTTDSSGKDQPATLQPSKPAEASGITTPEKPQAPSVDEPVAETPTEADTQPQIAWSLQIRAVEPTWMTVSADEKPPIEMSLKPDEVVKFKASDHFKLFIGNAGGIVLTLNDRFIGVPGNSGQVITLELP